MLTSSGLPTLPGYVFRLNQLLSEREPDMQMVTQVIRTDASLAAQVLRMANFYLLASQEPICSVTKAVQAVGAQRLRTMVITCPLLDCAADVTEWSCLQSFWQHNFMTAALSEAIAEYLDCEDPRRAYTAGLLRDIGELSLIAQCQREGERWPQATEAGRERRAREAGRRLAIACRFTPELVEVCGCDDPARAWHDPLLVKIVTAASRFCAANGLISGGTPQQLKVTLSRSQTSATLTKLFALGEQRANELADVLAYRFLELVPALEFSRSGLLQAAVAVPRATVAVDFGLQMSAIA
jgi:hypothetical protein